MKVQHVLVRAVLLLLLSGAHSSALVGAEIIVDASGGADFTSIQDAIDSAWDFDAITVNPGVYSEHISYRGKLVTVTSRNPNDPNVVASTVIDGGGDGNVVMFISAEGSYSMLRGLTIRNGAIGIYCAGSDTEPVIEKCVVTANGTGISGSYPSLRWNTITENTGPGVSGCHGEIIHCLVASNGSHGLTGCSGLVSHSEITANAECGIRDHSGEIKNCLITSNLSHGLSFEARYVRCTALNCTLVGNSGHGVSVTLGDANSKCVLNNCIVVQNRHYGIRKSVSSKFAANTQVIVDFCDVWGNELGSYRGAHFPITVGENNLHERPFFANRGYWDADGIWHAGDYHLRSRVGRWDTRSNSWMEDPIDSPCLDKGDPSTPVGDEPYPHGGVINLGAYGGTAEASMSNVAGPVCIEPPEMDFNNDCKVDVADFLMFMEHWLECNLDDPDACWPDGTPEAPVVPSE